LLEGCKKPVAGSDSEIEDNVLFALIEPKGIEIPVFVAGGDANCLVGDMGRVVVDASVEPEKGPGIDGNESKREAPKEDAGLNGAIPANPVVWGWMVFNEEADVVLKLCA